MAAGAAWHYQAPGGSSPSAVATSTISCG